MRRLIAVLGMLLAAVTVLAGCVDIPDSSSPQPIAAFDRTRPTNIVPTPRRGDDPETIARNFIKAMADPTAGHRSARRFLTPDASRGWDDRGETVVLRDVAITIDERTDSAVRLRITGDETGTLTSEGVLRPSTGEFIAAVSLTKTRGVWRISGDVPAGMITDSAQFMTAYRQIDLFFPDRTGRRLVADPRWLFGTEPDPSDIVTALLAGPTSVLDGAVAEGRTRGVTLAGHVSVSDSMVTVPLGNVSDTDPRARTVLAAQIIWTLENAGRSGTFRITADGAALVADREDGWHSADVNAFKPETASTGDAVHLIRGGGLQRFTGNRAVAVGGPLGGARNIVSAGVSGDLTQAAAVVDRDGRRRLMVGPYEGDPAEVAEGDVMTKPSFGPDADTGYLAVDGKPYQWVRDAASGQTRAGPLDASEVSAVARGPITDLRVSPDGVRVALVVDGRVLLSVLSLNDRGIPALSGVYALAPDAPRSAVGVAWSTAKTLYVAHSGHEAPVSRVSIAGTQPFELVTGNLKPPVVWIAATSTSVYVADNRGVQQIGTGQVRPDQYWTALGADAGPGSIPVVPGR